MSTYVISDIHGLKSRYDDLLSKIQFSDEDRMYIIGDVIDRGPDGIELLFDIQKRKNIVLLMGNHEHMMVEYYREIHKKGWKNFDIIERWGYNGNRPTRKAFEKLSASDQEKLLAYLEHLPLIIADLKVHEKTYYLVHAAPCDQILEGIATFDEFGFSSQAKYAIDPMEIVWTRTQTLPAKLMDRTTIIGHTPTLYYQDVKPYAIWYDGKDLESSHLIDIDCGCAANNAYTRLGCLCLDNLEVTYA